MNRRHFLTLTAAASLAAAARAANLSATKTRVAVIGHTGRGNYGHGIDTMWLKLPETEIVAVADADDAGRAAAQKRLGAGVKPFADYRAMLTEMKPEVVAIGPRDVSEHHAMCLAAIAAGARGIYMEKPFCRTLAEADEIIAAAEKAGTKVAVAHRNRYHPAIPAVDRLLKEGAIGRVLEIRGRGKEDARGGAEDLWVLGTHIFNLMRHFAGAPVACSANLYQDARLATKADLREGKEGIGPIAGNALHARFEMENGVPAYFDSIQNAGVAAANFGLQIIGNIGLIDVRIDESPMAHLVPGNPFQPTPATPRPWIPITSAGAGEAEPLEGVKEQSAAHLYAGRDLLAAIREERAPLCDARAARVTLEMVMAVFGSHLQNGARIPCPLAVRTHPFAT